MTFLFSLLITLINVALTWGLLLMGIVTLYHLCRYLSTRTDLADAELESMENPND